MAWIKSKSRNFNQRKNDKDISCDFKGSQLETGNTDSSGTFFVLVVVFIPLNVIIAALATLVGFYFYQEANFSIPTTNGGYLDDFPVFCEDLSLSPDDDDETFNTNKEQFKLSVDDDGRYVCAYNLKHSAGVISKFVERKSRIRTAKGLEWSKYFSFGNEDLARKSGFLTVTFSRVSPHQQFDENEANLILHWDKHPERSYKDSKIQYHNGKITIPEGRVYFVYASVHFRVPQRKNNRPYIFSLRICRKNFGYEEILLSKIQRFDVRKDYGASSLNLESHLLITKNDLIYVKVSDANAVLQESTGNTFGIFPL